MSNESQNQKTKTEPKFEPKFAEAKTDAKPDWTAFDPMTYWNASQQAFQRMMSDGYGRAQTLSEQYAAFENLMVSRAQAAVQTWSQLAQDAIAYGAQLSAEARKLSLDTVRRAATMASAGA